ncbi:PaaI family thioesterase [Lutimaribacter sp. EGI FJ00015]|uniref:PaaI family thioesterase n=1 Tax=Lutimaribacter degradans TaxID=2945989 RepID=A0ACC5ZXM7_9RHOB|nr:PaaI family thioesterase [Lutimaribacter sp. EGI FJ00013]MCM2562521.1 PaaI family thioesterase [Lutimaribacter sp. EGI FJ00013]MCO0613678.1 PaaI family thioesterase [Lutimaribacter sp. EGI FJ00015]MCO0636839.1 PaaI family thioesterase [Lutimaribacter sp. EGI FJ00014]
MDPRLKEDPYPLQAHMGFEMVDWRDGYARYDLPIASYLGNRSGIVHGGVQAMMLDTVMGLSGCFTGDPDAPQHAVTLSMTTNFLAQTGGDRLIAEGFKTGGGRKTFFARAQLTDNTGELIATSTGVFRYRSRE